MKIQRNSGTSVSPYRVMWFPVHDMTAHALMWYSSAATKTLFMLSLGSWIVTSSYPTAGLLDCPKSFIHPSIFPRQKLMFITQRNTAQKPYRIPGDAVTPRLQLTEQENVSLKQVYHSLWAVENRNSWPCLHTNAVSFLGQKPGILRVSG